MPPVRNSGAGAPARFQGLEVRIPTGYDSYLRRKYGDYRRDPPPGSQAGPPLPGPGHRLGGNAMNILQINCVYGVGSTGNITRDLHQALWPEGTAPAVLLRPGGL